MRSFLAALLLSSVVLPAVAHADPQDGERRSERRAAAIERVREAREQRAEQPRPERAVQVQRVERVEPPVARRDAADEAVRSERIERVRRVSSERRGQAADAADNGVVRRPAEDSVRDWRLRERTARGAPEGVVTAPVTVEPPEATAPERRPTLNERIADRVREQRSEPRETRTADRRPPIFRDLHDRRSAETFRHQWRRDHRYDWRRHRDRHRSLFRLGWYYDPFGWGYRRFDIGWTLRPTYWSDRYWLQDPWQWRLPTVYGPYRWIRYYDDALLVDVRTGRVVDVIHDVFW